MPIASPNAHIALFDVSSVPKWPEVIPRWIAAGYKAILLAAEDWGLGGAELRALHLGVAGIVDVTAEFGRRLVNAIAFVGSGQLFMKEEIVRKLHCVTQFPADYTSAAHLSFREKQVIDLLNLGFSNRRIGIVLGITERTAKFHVSNILRKLRLRSRGELRTVDWPLVAKKDQQTITALGP